jgi:wyosine [tRNA(Phe)-imidazoG37] synthetase (radical SAM superfamily)
MQLRRWGRMPVASFPSDLNLNAKNVYAFVPGAQPNGTRHAVLLAEVSAMRRNRAPLGSIPVGLMSDHVFGPVPSRRLGRSLGVDLVPFKTCTYDCIYCQLGPTTCRTLQRKEWVPVDRVLRELEQRLDARPDYVTLSGSGEPTLFASLDKLIDGIRARTDIPIAVLTNGSLLHNEEVQQELSRADLVIPSLDAGDGATFQLVNRPHESISFKRMMAGLVGFRRRFPGQFWLEVFLLGGYTTLERDLTHIRRCVDRIQPDRVQLNTVTRPPAEEHAIAVPRSRLEEIAATFSPPAEVIAGFHGLDGLEAGKASREEVLRLLRRRPCSVQDIAAGLGMHRNEALKCIEHLHVEGLVEASRVGGESYFRVVQQVAP